MLLPGAALAVDTGLTDCGCRSRQGQTHRWMGSDHRYVVAAPARAGGDAAANAAAQMLDAEGGQTGVARLED